MTRERDERATAGTRENLVRAALQEFATRGYDGSSVREICAAAGVTTGALYFFFKNKENLFREAISPVMEPLEDLIRSVGSDRVSKLIAEGQAPEEGLPARARRFLELCEDGIPSDAKRAHVEGAELARISRDVREPQRLRHVRIHPHLRRNGTQKLKGGAVRKDDRHNTPLAWERWGSPEDTLSQAGLAVSPDLTMVVREFTYFKTM